MADRIRCLECGAEPFTDGAKMACKGCYSRQQAEIERLTAELASVTADRDERAVQKGELLKEIERLKEERNALDTVQADARKALGDARCKLLDVTNKANAEIKKLMDAYESQCVDTQQAREAARRFALTIWGEPNCYPTVWVKEYPWLEDD